MKQKLTSRKFWVGVGTVVSGILMMFGFADSTIEIIAGAIVTLGGAIGYMIAESIVDAKRISTVIESATTIAGAVTSEKEATSKPSVEG